MTNKHENIYNQLFRVIYICSFPFLILKFKYNDRDRYHNNNFCFKLALLKGISELTLKLIQNNYYFLI